MTTSNFNYSLVSSSTSFIKFKQSVYFQTKELTADSPTGNKMIIF